VEKHKTLRGSVIVILRIRLFTEMEISLIVKQNRCEVYFLVTHRIRLQLMKFLFGLNECRRVSGI